MFFEACIGMTAETTRFYAPGPNNPDDEILNIRGGLFKRPPGWVALATMRGDQPASLGVFVSNNDAMHYRDPLLEITMRRGNLAIVWRALPTRNHHRVECLALHISRIVQSLIR